MKHWTKILAAVPTLPLLLAATAAAASPVAASPVAAVGTNAALFDTRDDDDDAQAELPYLQCVPYARQISGIQIYGDAWTWWGQAENRYERGYRPKVGAVMSFRPHGNMRLGHVAAVSRVIDSRTVLLRHANWSPIDGRRGQIEDNVRAIDVSPGNDWSEVRVWFAPLGNLGTTHWPLNGFIYPQKAKAGAKPLAPRVTVASAAPVRAPAAAPQRLAASQPVSPPARPARSRVGPDFLKGVATDAPVTRTASAPARQPAARQPATRQLAASEPRRAAPAQPPVQRAAKPAKAPVRADDPIGRIIASRSR